MNRERPYRVQIRLAVPRRETDPELYYIGLRVVSATDPDDACARAVERERARQDGVRAAGGIAHDVGHVIYARPADD